MHRTITGWAAVLALAVASPAAASARGASTGAVIRDWNETARSQAFENPVRLARILAIMHAAQHDAVNGARPRYETYASTLRDRRRRRRGRGRGRRARGARRVLPGQPSSARRAARGVALSRPRRSRRGRGRGTRARRGRRRPGGARGRRVRHPGSVQPHARARNLGTDAAGVRADARTAVPERDAVHASHRAQFLPAPPPALTSRRYARDYDEVKRIGQDISPARTADQTHVAHFWVEPSPSGWSRVGNLVSARYRYDLHRTARLQALLNMAMADGFIVGWYQKRHFAFWRPVTAIRKADTDGNPSDRARSVLDVAAPDAAAARLPVDAQPPRRRRRGGPAPVHRDGRLPVLHGLDDLDTARDAAVLALVHARRARERRVARARRLPLPLRDRNRCRGRA